MVAAGVVYRNPGVQSNDHRPAKERTRANPAYETGAAPQFMQIGVDARTAS